MELLFLLFTSARAFRKRHAFRPSPRVAVEGSRQQRGGVARRAHAGAAARGARAAARQHARARAGGPRARAVRPTTF